MADYSKQYCERYGMGFEGDFDIDEEFENLMPGYYINLICEGYGFIALHKTEDKELMCVFSDINDELKLIPYDEITDKTVYKLNLNQN